MQLSFTVPFSICRMLGEHAVCWGRDGKAAGFGSLAEQVEGKSLLMVGGCLETSPTSQ